ncbi:MAG: hypothetical protein KC620_09815 [Myxococcales bacterium]|nr:hypothetical protein [Myxococcales bacterium]
MDFYCGAKPEVVDAVEAAMVDGREITVVLRDGKVITGYPATTIRMRDAMTGGIKWRVHFRPQTSSSDISYRGCLLADVVEVVDDADTAAMPAAAS